MKGMLNGLIALVCLVVASLCLYKYQTDPPPPNTLFIIGAGVFALLMVVFGVMFVSGRVSKTEEIHITE